MTDDPASLDPDDWDAFRAAAHDLLDSCIDRLAAARVEKSIGSGHQFSASQRQASAAW